MIVSLKKIEDGPGVVKFGRAAATANPTGAKKFTVTTFSGKFYLSQAGKVSAGVYRTSTGQMVRTLFSARQFSSGTHILYWDGNDDFETPVSGSRSDYEIRLISGNVTYEWEGVIGNTSTNKTGSSVHTQWNPMSGMVIVGTTAYYSAVYQEKNPSMYKFSTSAPNVCIPITTIATGNSGIHDCITDNTNVYWAQDDPFGNKNFIVATTVASDAVVSFSSGVTVPLTFGPTFTNCIDSNTLSNGQITGMAVQTSSSPGYLFVSHGSLNEIHVLNKTTGALVQTVTPFPNPKKLAIQGTNLWIQSGTNTLEKYPINSDGTLGTSTLSISGLVAPLAMAISPDGTTIAVCDAGTSQQVKAYSTTTGNLMWTLGTAGGYLTDPTVSTSKFLFTNNVDAYQYTFITYASDGSFWVGDTGNRRALHFSSSRSYVEQIMYLARPYACSVDKNNPTRVFAGYLEFEVDYSKPLLPTNNSWTLKRNWIANTPSIYTDSYIRLNSVMTLSNNRTYALLRNNTLNLPEVVELPPSGTLRFTGITVPFGTKIRQDGSLWRIVKTGTDQTWFKRTLTGFNGSNNPTWGIETSVLSTTDIAVPNPIIGGNYTSPEAITDSGVFVSFNGSATDNNRYHLGGIKAGDSNWRFRASLPNHSEYLGEYPTDGRFDIGNLMGASHPYAGNFCHTTGRSIFWGYNGEFWKNGQTNKWNHFYDNGLFIGQFGNTRFDTFGERSAYGMAGNSFYSNLITVASDPTIAYLYHGEENDHCGIHRWKISGLNTIIETVVPITNSVTLLEPALPGVDLLSDLTFLTSVTDGVNGWSRNPTVDSGNNWQVKTSVKSYKKYSPDLYVNFSSATNTTASVSKDLGNNSGLSSWQLITEISMDGNEGNNANNGIWLEVLDTGGLAIARFYMTIDYTVADRTNRFFGNTSLIASGTRAEMLPTKSYVKPLTISVSGTTVSFKYADFAIVNTTKSNVSAIIGSPKTMRILAVEGGGGPAGLGRTMDLYSARFLNL